MTSARRPARAISRFSLEQPRLKIWPRRADQDRRRFARENSHMPSWMAVLVAVASAVAMSNAGAQEGDIAAGRAFAREACKPCHVVEPLRAPRMLEIGPAFRDIADTPGMTGTALKVFLTSSHPKMPNLVLTPQEMTDVTAYILGLRRHR